MHTRVRKWLVYAFYVRVLAGRIAVILLGICIFINGMYVLIVLCENIFNWLIIHSHVGSYLYAYACAEVTCIRILCTSPGRANLLLAMILLQYERWPSANINALANSGSDTSIGRWTRWSLHLLCCIWSRHMTAITPLCDLGTIRVPTWRINRCSRQC